MHVGPGGAHHNEDNTCSLLHRSCCWQGNAHDVAVWVAACLVCNKHQKAVESSPQHAVRVDPTQVPWGDVMVDCRWPLSPPDGQGICLFWSTRASCAGRSCWMPSAPRWRMGLCGGRSPSACSAVAVSLDGCAAAGATSCEHAHVIHEESPADQDATRRAVEAHGAGIGGELPPS